VATKWTDDQFSAIESREQNLLLSAAAGSGKTAVLVERIIQRITDSENPVDADKLLVVTFTNAAANEMRERIEKSLEKIYEQNPKNKNIARQLTLLKKAQITTIDSFCIDVLRNNFVEADLSPDFGVADPTECKVMLDQSLDDAINEMYDDKIFGADFLYLMESYANSKANDVGFRDLITSIYYFSTSLPYPDEWLNDACNRFLLSDGFSDSFYKDALMKEAHAECERAVSEYEIMIDLAEEDTLFDFSSILREEKYFFEDCIKTANYDELRQKLLDYNFKRRPQSPKNVTPMHLDTINDMRKKIKERRMGKLCEKLLVLSSRQQEETIKKMYPLMKCLSETVKRLTQKFSQMKLSKNLLDFSDCEHYCLNVLKNQAVAQKYKKHFDEIYIDEYQDTSKLQEDIFSCIKRENNLFMVGDIKQSIYRFRNTDPILFKTKKDEFSKDEEAKNRKIILSKNFRSRKNILDCVNFIFERIMSEDSGEIEYNEDEKLYLGASFPDDSPNPIDYKTEVAIIDTKTIAEDDEDDLGKIELQALFCAKRISELINSGAQIYENGTYRNITYKDICIVSRNISDNSVILNAVFSDYGIPCYAENTGAYFKSREVELMLLMLAVIDNPYQDLPLLSVLRSVFFNVSSETIAKIRCCNKKGTYFDAIVECSKTETIEGELCKGIIATIEDFNEKSKHMSVSELILDIYNTTGFFDAQKTTPNGIIRCANLKLLYNRAKAYENTGLKGLYSFIKFINDFKETGSDLEAAKLAAEQNDAVRIMSIHKSKGLEFPVVILFAAEHQFNLMDLRKSILYHADLGYGPKFVDTNLRITYNFAPRATLESALYRESLAEEMRILYVALTRAKEKLIIVGSDKNISAKVKKCMPGKNSKQISAPLVTERMSYLEWIITALIDHKDGGELRKYLENDRSMYIISDESSFSVSVIGDLDELCGIKSSADAIDDGNSVDEDKILDLMKYTYPDIDETKLPSKITVSELKANHEEILSEGFELFKKRKTIAEKPAGLTAAQIGTAYHTVLQKCDLTAKLDTKDAIKEQIENIKNHGFLTEEEAGAVNPDKILKFFKSGIGRMLLSAKEVKREYMFGVGIKAKNFITTTNSEKEIMLQGVIDCLLITDEGVIIIDYKTDRSYDAKDTIEKYKIQLDCYKYAAEMIFKKPVIRKILYMLESDMGINL